MRRVRMGMVGGGRGAFIGAVHRMAAALDQEIELVAGCFSRDLENTLETGRQLRLEQSRCYESFGEMARREATLPDDKRIDFVTIVTPTVSHFEIASAFLRAGFHVVVDKPLTYSLAEARGLAELVESTGLILAVTHNYNAYPMVRHAAALCRDGRIGAIRKVIVEYLQDFLMFPHEKHGHKQASWRVDPAQVGAAGTMGEAGVHGFALLEYITGLRVTELCADRTIFLPGRVLEEDANVLLRLGNGGRGILTVSQIATGEDNNLNIKIHGSEGGLSWSQENPNYLELTEYGQPRRILSRGHREYLGEEAERATRIPPGHPEGYIEAFGNLYREVADAIRRHAAGRPLAAGEYLFSSVYDGLRSLVFIERAVESCDSGSVWVSLEGNS